MSVRLLSEESGDQYRHSYDNRRINRLERILRFNDALFSRYAASRSSTSLSMPLASPARVILMNNSENTPMFCQGIAELTPLISWRRAEWSCGNSGFRSARLKYLTPGLRGSRHQSLWPAAGKNYRSSALTFLSLLRGFVLSRMYGNDDNLLYAMRRLLFFQGRILCRSPMPVFIFCGILENAYFYAPPAL